MTPDKLRHTAELALIYAVPMLSEAKANSRLCGLQKTLQKWAAKDLAKIPYLKDHELNHILGKIMEWGKQTGWLNSTKHTGTLLSFCAGMIEASKFEYHPRIMDTINDLIAHLENGKDFKIQSCWAGSLAAERWEQIFKEV